VLANQRLPAQAETCLQVFPMLSRAGMPASIENESGPLLML